MTPRLILRTLTAAACTVLAIAEVVAANEIGTLVAVRGRAELRRASAGNWKTATVGAPIYALDEFRTDDDSRVKLLFDDESVVVVATDSEVTVKSYGKKDSNNVLSLERGRVMVLLPKVPGREAATFEVETPTAVAQGNGAELLVEYDSEESVTQVYGVRDTVDVQGAIGLIGPTLKVQAGERTRIEKGKFPEPVETVDATELAAITSGIEMIGTGRADGIAATHPILTGGLTRSDEKPSQVRATGSSRLATGVSYLKPTAPGETLLEQLSPAARANTQPIPEYEYGRPDRVPPPINQ